MNSTRVLLILYALIFTSLAPHPVECRGHESVKRAVPIRIGWQIPAATQAQLVQVLERTDVLELHGLDPSLVPFSYGGPQVDAAFAGKLDVIFAGDQPAINLIARGGKWKIVARLFDDRVAIIVPPNSPIQEVKDLKGKTIASPFGSVAQREALLEQQVAGLDPNKDVDNDNMDILEIRRRVVAGGLESWNGIDAAVVWEPIVSRFEQEGLARTLTTKRTLGVVAISDEFIANHPEASIQFLAALIRAWDFFSRHTDEVMQWYLEDTRLDYTPGALIAARLDTNFRAESLQEIDLDLNEEVIASLEEGAAWAREAGNGAVEIRRSTDQTFLTQAKEAVATGQFEDIQVILPSTAGTALTDTEYSYALDSIPLGAMFAIVVFTALVAIEFGFWLGKRNRKKLENESVRPIATVVGAVLGLMAFVIALTFGSANNRFDARKTALLDDVTAIQTAYLRANLLPEPHRTTLRKLLRDYVQARAGIVYAFGQPDTLRLVRRRAEVLQELMWSHVEALADTDSDTKTQALFTSALNDVINLHAKRVVLGVYNRIPGFVWIVLVIASAVAMIAVGYQFGIGCGRRILPPKLALAVTFGLVMVLAFDLDRTGKGLVEVNQQPMIDLYRTMSEQK